MRPPSESTKLWAIPGKSSPLTEEEYNQKLLDVCRGEGIKIVGIANHGNVDEIDAIRTLLSSGGILVFPGFEIESSEKIHFVCLFPEDTPISTLNVYLGGCGIDDPVKGTQPSSKSANEIIDYVSGKGGGIYAAHCTQTNGILSGTNRYSHIWKNPNLAAVQIPGSIEDLNGAAEGGKLYQIVTNKNPDYKREHPIAVLNAKDVDQPDTLRDPTASCLIKMTIPCFDSFKQAFYDPESRVRLNSDRTKQWYSVIEKISITGGNPDGLSTAAVSRVVATGRRMNGAEMFMRPPPVAPRRRSPIALLRAREAMSDAIEEDVDHRRGVEREDLAQQEAAHHRDSKRPP